MDRSVLSTDKRILLLSAYRSDSHAAWVTWLTQHLDADWRVLELPGRYFRWRIRGNPLSWREELTELLADWKPDHILATSMVDVATLRGLLPALASVPLTYYFHENQFSYPVGTEQHSSVDPQMVQLYGALAADRCLFNSQYNLNSFVSGVDDLLKKLPDCRPESLRQELEGKSSLLPVPVDGVSSGVKTQGLIVWNHRWEYDKRPDLFLAILQELRLQGVPFSLALLGPRPAKIPATLEDIRTQFHEVIVADGRVSRAEYCDLLRRAQVVISCADHEFQGLSMIEAVSAGCVPVAPDALCYQEQYPSECRYKVHDTDSAVERIRLAFDGQLPSPEISSWLSEATAERWLQWLKDDV